MSLTNNSTDEIINSITTAVNNIIDHRLDVDTMTIEDAKILCDMLIRIRTDPDLLNAYICFSKSFIDLDKCWIKGVSSASNKDMASSENLARMLVSILL